MICVAVFGGTSTAAADHLDLGNGSYAIDYVVLQPDSDSVSIANDYFAKPAILTKTDDTTTMSITVNQSEWVKALRVANGQGFEDVKVVSENTDENTRDITFAVNQDLAEPIYMQMDIRIEEMTPVYDHSYTVRYVFDMSTAEIMASPPDSDQQQQEQEDDVDGSMKLIIYAIVLLLVVIGSIYFISKKRKRIEN